VATQKDNGNNYTRTEDNYKHIVEMYLDLYISNGFFLQTTIDEGYAILSHHRMRTSIYHKNSLIILKNNTIKIYKLTPK
jgi:hypothetical protein